MKKNKRTLNDILESKEIKRPLPIVNGTLRIVSKLFMGKKYNIKKYWIKDIRKVKGPFIFVSNHASRGDYVFNTTWINERFNYVVGYNEFFRSHVSGIFKSMHCIPKKNFSPDLYAMREITRVLRNGGCISIYPEGMNSISGHSQPVASGTGKFLKHFKVPVYYSVIKGGYLSQPKFNLTDRLGTTEVYFDQMFTPGDLEKLSPSEIEDVMNEKLYHDDYRWNLEKKYEYDGKGKIAEGLHTLLWKCPKCGAEHKMISEGNIIKCSNCGNGATIDSTYKMTPFNDTCVIPETQTDWFDWEREEVKKEIQDPNFELKEHVKLGNLPEYKQLTNFETSIIVGEGTITLNRTGFYFDGTRNGQPFSFHLNSDEVPSYGMCTDLSRFYTFYKGEFMEFYPDNQTVEKWFMATEEIHRLNGGKWQDYKFKR